MSIIKIQEKKDSGISLHHMKKIEIIVSGEHEAVVAEIMKESKVVGFTLIRNASGMGHSGYHEGKMMFNDTAALVMFIAVASEEVITDVAVGMKTLLEKNSGVMFVSDVAVARSDYFIKK